jgi:hypothetical protein
MLIGNCFFLSCLAYGRRPVMLFTTLIAAASSIGSGKATSWSSLIAARVRGVHLPSNGSLA